MTIRGPIPEHIRRLMPDETRKELGKAAETQAEADARFTARAEKLIQENIAGLLRGRGIYFIRQRMDRKTTGPVGQVDFVFAINGRAIAVEVKTPTGLCTDEQLRTAAHMVSNGWLYQCVRSEKEFLEFLNKTELVVRLRGEAREGQDV